MNFQGLRRKLHGTGILLLSDKALPNVVCLVAGPKVKGSWWGHESGHEIFRDLKELDADPDSLTTRLVSGKVTYLHRRLWPDFLTVATAKENWQLRGLTGSARRLLSKVDLEGEVRTDKMRPFKGLGEATREIERRLLVYTEEIHTEKGFHAKALMAWSRTPKIQDLRFRLGEPRAAKEVLETVMDDLNSRYHGKGKLPWRQ
ncbi:MAG TPA: hypothetical protein VGR56_04785 [Nitrososphaerales archaeon]|nr:hypothetical protein [Nitrososphaerales archaeon]